MTYSICAHCAKALDKKDMLRCDSCSASVCKGCFKRWLEDRVDPSPRMNSLCMSCLVNFEREYIIGLKREDLPLHINIQWFLEGNEKFYKTRLARGY